ncbi:MAG: hypothetical protein IJD57_06815 [Candidatus Gastranaerophilales bacterium]|nr:hypothetical protein [Candidatus Gastranaerophilales bacterium]
MGLSASQARQLLLTAKRNDLEFRAQQISQQRLILSSQLEEIATEYENATSNRQMQIQLYSNGNAEDASALKQTTNLTYQDLVSGCALIGNASKINVTAERGSLLATTAYHLKNADGATVVSSLEEIPGIGAGDAYYVLYDENDHQPNVQKWYKDGGEYVPYPESGEKYENDASGKYIYNGTTYVEFSSLSEEDKTKFNGNDRFKRIDLTSKTLYVQEKTGSDAEYLEKILDAGGTLPEGYKSDSNREIIITKSGTIKIGTTDQQGNVTYEEYVLDKNLARGGTDKYGNNSKTGPNYLQDMLRNGVYTLDKYNSEQKEWSSVSWDSAIGITDRYYTEDDDAAKAKYDRLQNEIQRQDKKLELELDNIETQRSAITTEEESVQKVMDDNIEGTFKTFA